MTTREHKGTFVGAYCCDRCRGHDALREALADIVKAVETDAYLRFSTRGMKPFDRAREALKKAGGGA